MICWHGYELLDKDMALRGLNLLDDLCPALSVIVSQSLLSGFMLQDAPNLCWNQDCRLPTPFLLQGNRGEGGNR